jgi:putative membrane protein
VRVKSITALIALVGVAVAVWLVARTGAGNILEALQALGWPGFLSVLGLHFLVIAATAFAWQVLCLGRTTVGPGGFIWARLMRDAGSEVLPLSQVGGYVLGARALALRGASGTLTAASTIVDITLDVMAQLVFTAVAIALLALRFPQLAALRPLIAGSSVLLVLLGIFVALQRGTWFRSVAGSERASDNWGRRALAKLLQARELTCALYQRPGAIITCLLAHGLGWVLITTEAWLALRWMGVAISWPDALVLEGLLFAIRSVAFSVPSAAGVQEGAYLLLASWLHLPAAPLLALSLAKRLRDLVMGLPPLLVWQWLEGRAWLSASPARSAAAAQASALTADLLTLEGPPEEVARPLAGR